MSKQRSTLLPKTATMSNEFCVEISSFRQSRKLLRHCCRFWQQCRSKIRHCRKNRSTCSVRQRCFDIVASMDGALVLHLERAQLRFAAVIEIRNLLRTVTRWTTVLGRWQLPGLLCRFSSVGQVGATVAFTFEITVFTHTEDGLETDVNRHNSDEHTSATR